MKRIKIYSIHCGGDNKSKYFYETIAKRTGGRYLTLANMKNICDIFVALCLRSSDEKKFEQFSDELISNKNVDKELENALKELKTKETNASAVKRLMKDLKQLKTENLSNIACVPDKKDIFKWHCNVQVLQGALQSVYIHLILTFPLQYPSRPPNIYIHSYFINDIHPNIIDNAICMDTLRANIGWDGSTGTKWGGWTAAYTITSLLINIASLFSDIITLEQEQKNANDDDSSMDDDMSKHRRRQPKQINKNKKRSRWSKSKYLTQTEMDNLIKRIRQTDCDCGHSHYTPYPPLQCDISPVNIVCDDNDENGIIIAGTVIKTKIQDKFCKIRSLFGIETKHECVAWQFTLDWFDIDNSNDILQKSSFIMGFSDNTGNFFGVNDNGFRIYNNGIDKSLKVFNKKLKQNDTISLIIYLSENIKEENRILISINNEYKSNIVIPEYYNKINKFYPTMFLKNVRIKLQFEANNELNALPSKYNLPINNVKMISQLPEITGFKQIDKHRQFYQTQKEWNNLLEKSLSSDVILIICSCLLYEDISRCKQLNTHWFYTIDTYLVLERLSTNCYYTGDSSIDDILGVGIYIEYNDNDDSKNNDDTRISWISIARSEMDYLSLTAWNEFKVREGAWGEKLTHFLPLIINEKHGEKSKQELLKRISILSNVETFSEEIALIGIGALMSQFVVQLMGDVDIDDNIIDIKHSSEKALNGYCAFHHLLLYLCHKFPLMRLIAYKNVNDFISNYKKRWKSHTPDLGKFLINLSIIDDEAYDKIDFKEIFKAFIDESLDRSVKWYLKKHPSLENMAINKSTSYSDSERLETIFKATQTGRRLILFQYWFIKNISRPKNKKLIEILNDYNKKWGKPTEKQKKKLMKCVKDILNKKTNYVQYNWINYFDDLGVSNYECFQTEEEIVKILKESVIRSQIKGYHKKNKFFSDTIEYKNIAKNVREIELKELELLNDCPSGGPMSRLKHMMESQKDVMLIMRMTEGQYKQVIGKIKSFDRHWNIIMINPKEYWKKQISYSKKHKPIFIHKNRLLGKYVFIRGDDIVSIRILHSVLNQDKQQQEQDLIDID